MNERHRKRTRRKWRKLGAGRPRPVLCAVAGPLALAAALLALPAGATDKVYVSSSEGGSIGDLVYGSEDILVYTGETEKWSIHFDGSSVGLEQADVDAFHLLDDPEQSILMSFSAPVFIPRVGLVDDSDIVRFVPSGPEDGSNGIFRMYFDGSDVGLSSPGEDIDALALTQDGRLIVSPSAFIETDEVSARDEDLVVFNHTSLGPETSGTFELYFDGSDVGLFGRSEDVWGHSSDPLSRAVYLTTQGAYGVRGLSGEGSDVIVCDLISSGEETLCDSFALFWRGSEMGLPSELVDGLFVSLSFSRLAKLGDLVFEDLNGNGLQDAGEPGLGGVTVELQDDLGTAIRTTETVNDGSYLFLDVAPGTYFLRFVVPSGRELTLADVGTDDTIDSDADPITGRTEEILLYEGESDLTYDAGMTRRSAARLGDFVFEDIDGDGLQDAGEPGVSAVRVDLEDAGGTLIATTTTTADGGYGFVGLDAGTYSVQFTAPGGFLFTRANAGSDDALDSDPDPMTGRTAAITLAAGEDNPSVDAGLVSALPSSLGDYVFEDRNRNGMQDPEERGIEGVIVNLLDELQQVIATTTTPSGGNYAFSGLGAGTYQVQFVAPDGYDFTLANAGSDDTLDSDADPVTGRTGPIVLGFGEDDSTNDAGLVRQLISASVGDRVFDDADKNGIQDAGEAGVAGVSVELQDQSGTPIASTLTAVDGAYRFSGLSPGTYHVRFISPDERQFTAKDVGTDDAVDSDAEPATGRTGPIVLDSGEEDWSVDAGLISPLDYVLSPGETIQDIRYITAASEVLDQWRWFDDTVSDLPRELRYKRLVVWRASDTTAGVKFEISVDEGAAPGSYRFQVENQLLDESYNPLGPLSGNLFDFRIEVEP